MEVNHRLIIEALQGDGVGIPFGDGSERVVGGGGGVGEQEGGDIVTPGPPKASR